jgi:hypothetical protein
MTRDEFYLKYAAIRSTHPGYSAAELSTLNAAVFADVGPLDAGDIKTQGIVNYYFWRAIDAARAAALHELAPDEDEPAPAEPAPKPESPSDDSAPDEPPADEPGGRILFPINNQAPMRRGEST